ncbi:complement C3-like [Centruroides sculpturatus]|uniref:complement C3-like n=1 Tax=Centruroides sculpturatus TaxID=218467 RepID=UPI000C6D89C8|nr:complement C3-like [Centruroides sculpturatus]
MSIFGTAYLHVIVEAKIEEKFKTDMKLPIDYSRGYVFLQTDKPIYTPRQTVQVRIIPLNEKMLPENYNLRVQIKNPQNIIVQDTLIRDPWILSSSQFPKMNFTFPPFPMLGKWSVSALYGIQFQKQSSVSFHVEEYILPVFALKVRVSSAILSKDGNINITVGANYIHGSDFHGNIECKLNIVTQGNQIIPAGVKTAELYNTEKRISVTAEELLKEAQLENFPFNSELSINVSVTDTATGITEKAEEDRIKLALPPYRISLKYMLSYYKPGFSYEIVADIFYLNGKPAEEIPVIVNVTDSNDKKVILSETKHVTNENGRVIFHVIPPRDINYMNIDVRTNDNRYESEQQAFAIRRIYKFASNNFISISRTQSTRKLKIGENFAATVFTNPPDQFENIFYVVMARGRIQLMRPINTEKSYQKQLDFIVTSEMAPIVRVVVFSLFNRELFVDSVKIEVEADCDKKSKVIISRNVTYADPGTAEQIELKGKPKTKVGLIGVDKAVYSLKNEDRLTKEKIFKKIATSDYGAEVAEGMNSLDTLSNSGLVLFGNFEVENTYNEDIGITYFSILPDLNDFFTFDLIDESTEHSIPVRSDFRETWLFEDYEIGSDGTRKLRPKLPDSITKWELQVVSLSPQWGICVSDVTEISSLKKFFLHLNIPYSIVRNEQLDLQVTVFNYLEYRMPAIVYMYGVKDLLSGASEGEKSERINMTLESNSIERVNFTIVPLVAKDYVIRVVAICPAGVDVVEKKLHVVPEGITEELDFVNTIDPTNQQKRKKEIHIVSDVLRDMIFASEQRQQMIFYVHPRRNYIPGTEMLILSVIGTEYGPTAQTVLIDPKDLIRMPTGCCEQTMTYLGPTLYTLNFLKSKGKIDLETEERLYDFVGEGYRRALTFRNEDGSFSLWPRKPSSVWLTSFVTKIFCQASKLIYIDKNVICKGMEWITYKQNSDGSFEDYYPVIRTDIMYGSDGKIPMTAFVLSVLQECNCSSVNINDVQLKAKSFLEMQYETETIDDPYVMALTAYAFAATNSKKKLEANEMLLEMSTYNEGLNQRYWDRSSITESIEIAAYGLLSQLQLKNMTTARSIVNWLNIQRLDGGYFPSSQATVIALQALSEYLISSKRQDINLTLSISTSHDRSMVRTLQINNDNALILQQIEINKLGGYLYVNASGKGVGFLSMRMKYNREDMDRQPCKFQTTVDVSEVKENLSMNATIAHYEKEHKTEVSRLDCIRRNLNRKFTLKIKICTTYFFDIYSNMTIIDAAIFSGFKPVKEDLERVINDITNPVDFYEVEDRNIIFYLSYFTPKSTVCFEFRVVRDYIIGNVQSGVVQVYDYYKYGGYDTKCTVFFSPDTCK